MAKRQRNVGWAIRDDGLLFPAFPKILAQPNFRPYHGDPKASLEDRLAYLRGEIKKGNYQPDLTPGTFDIGKATRGQLLDFAERNYGKVLDISKDIDALRAEVAALAEGAGDMESTEEDDEDAPKTGRQHRLSKHKDNYPSPGDDTAAVQRAKALAAAKGVVGAGVSIPKL